MNSRLVPLIALVVVATGRAPREQGQAHHGDHRGGAAPAADRARGAHGPADQR